MDKMSPKYRINLIDNIISALWSELKTWQKVILYLRNWQQIDYNCIPPINISICYIMDKDGNKTDRLNLYETLNSANEDTLLQIAIDLGVETPDFIPSIPTFRNAIKAECPTASATFENAYKHIESEPETAIGLANSALESIIKEILKDNRITTQWSEKHSLYKLTVALLKEFKLTEGGDMPEEIKSIGTSLITIAQKIEDLRSNKSYFHGKTDDDYVVSDPMYVYFVVNSVCTVGLFLRSFYKKYYPAQQVIEYNNEFEIDDLPF